LLKAVALSQRLAVDERHYIVEESVGFSGVEQRQDVGMREVGGDLSLAPEALDAEAGSEFGTQDLDGYSTRAGSAKNRVPVGRAATSSSYSHLSTLSGSSLATRLAGK